MVKVKNTGERIEMVHTTGGVIRLHPGQERELELTEPGAKLVEASDTLTTGGRQGRKRTQKPVDAETQESVVDTLVETMGYSTGKP